MNKNVILHNPTAKIQIGNHTAITLDTASSNGKTTYNISLVTENDSITRRIEDIKEEVETEMENIKREQHISLEPPEINHNDKKLEILHDLSSIVFPMLIIVIPTIVVFAFAAYSKKQKRLWREALLNKGISVQEIYDLENNRKNGPKEPDEELMSYNRRKTLKYAIIFGSIGLAMLFATILDSDGPGYFFGMLFLLLGTGLWYYNEKFK